jgi:hypothetical protein
MVVLSSSAQLVVHPLPYNDIDEAALHPSLHHRKSPFSKQPLRFQSEAAAAMRSFSLARLLLASSLAKLAWSASQRPLATDDDDDDDNPLPLVIWHGMLSCSYTYPDLLVSYG